jgi:hypothetical protein
VDDEPGVAIPESIVGCHPFRRWTTLRSKPLILGSVRLPRNISQFDRINLGMEVLMIGDGGEIVVRDERCPPDIEKLIDDVLREVGLEV